MGRVRLLLSICCISLLAGCVTSKQWSEVGSKREAGLVKLAYEYTATEITRLEAGQADQLATQRCREWGFTGSEAFGTTSKKCIENSQSGGCGKWQVYAIFQCIGKYIPAPN